ncbi:MAG: hypothetical protein QM784_02350 [Polyangiaceae bacterium]
MRPNLLAHDPNPDGTCRVCRGPIHPETWLCTRCGAAHGERNRCPHCRTIARTLPHPTLVHRCSVCGKPRFPGGPTTQLASPSSVAALKRAGSASTTARVLSILSYALMAVGLGSLIFTLLFLWVWSPGILGYAIALTLALLPWMVAFYGRIAANRSETTREAALSSAYSEQILAALGAAHTGATAEQIAGWLGLPVVKTEALLATLNADDRMTSHVTDDGELLYGVIQPRLRVASTKPFDTPSDSKRIAPSLELENAELENAELENADVRQNTARKP